MKKINLTRKNQQLVNFVILCAIGIIGTLMFAAFLGCKPAPNTPPERENSAALVEFHFEYCDTINKDFEEAYYYASYLDPDVFDSQRINIYIPEDLLTEFEMDFQQVMLLNLEYEVDYDIAQTLSHKWGIIAMYYSDHISYTLTKVDSTIPWWEEEKELEEVVYE